MGIYRIPLVADNTISTYSSLPSLTGLGNAGAAPIVDVWASYIESKNKKYIARALVKANLTALSQAQSAGTVPTIDASVSCNLKMFHINHAENQAYDFTIYSFPVTRSWVEGKGTRIDSFTNTGFSSWASASTTASWTSPGGDYVIDSNSGSQYFESGYEHLSINAKGILTAWLNSVSANYGLLLRMDSNAESLTGSNSSNTQYYRKSFHGRNTNYYNFAPYFELTWDDSIKDDRNVGVFGNSINLYFYNAPNGIYTDIDASSSYFPGTVVISGNSSAVTTATTTRVKPGIYKATFTLPASAGSFTAFTDTWTVTSASSAVQRSTVMTFNPIRSVTGSSNYSDWQTSVRLLNYNGKDYSSSDQGVSRYPKGAILTKKLFIYERTGMVSPLVQSESNSISSIAASTIASYITTSGYWRVFVPDLGVTEIDWQPLSYDAYNNYFSLDTSNLSRNIKYRFEFKINVRNQVLIYDNDISYYFLVE